MARGNQSFVYRVNPLTEGQNPVNPFSINILAVLPLVKAKFLSNLLGIAHLP